MRALQVGLAMMGGAIALGAAGAVAGGYRFGAPTGPTGPGWTVYYLVLFVALVTGAYLTGIDRLAARPPPHRRSRVSFAIALLLLVLAGLLLAFSFGPGLPSRAEGRRTMAIVAAATACSMAVAGSAFLLLERRRARAPSP